MKIRKTIFLLLTVVWLLNCSASVNEKLVALNRDDIHLSQSGKYLLHGGKPFEGIVSEVFENGVLKNQARYKNGLLDGTSMSWYPDGRKESERYYEKGEKEGVHISWWPNGNRRFEYQFTSGLYNGTFKEWYENARPLHVFLYNHGNEVKAIGWRENGKTYINFVVRNGKKYGLTNARLCYSLKDEQGVYQSSNN